MQCRPVASAGAAPVLAAPLAAPELPAAAVVAPGFDAAGVAVADFVAPADSDCTPAAAPAGPFPDAAIACKTKTGAKTLGHC